PDKSPYKTHASCWFYHRDGSRAVGRGAGGKGGAGFYFQIAPGDSFVGGGMWMPPRDALLKLREAIGDDPKRISKIATDRRLARRPVPVREVRRGVVGALEERQQRVDRRRGGADRGVGQNEYPHRRMVVHGAGLRDEVAETRRLGRGIRVERSLLHGPASGPEPGADHFVR